MQSEIRREGDHIQHIHTHRVLFISVNKNKGTNAFLSPMPRLPTKMNIFLKWPTDF